jgi:heme oxygenase (biliverdin-IX-beta and delta-forming)
VLNACSGNPDGDPKQETHIYIDAEDITHASPPLRQRLKTETRQEHETLEQALDLLRPDLTLDEYKALLRRFHMFHSAFDVFAEAKRIEGWDSAAFYCRDRMKKDWLRSDLVSLGMEPAESDFPPALLAELLPTARHLWGAVYVLEGSTLGGAILAKHFSQTHGLTRDAGLRFFTSYGTDTAQMWNLTLAGLRQCEEQGLGQDAIIEGATRIFELLGRHLPAHDSEGERHA